LSLRLDDFLLAQVFFSKKKKCVYAYKFRGKRYDAGDKQGSVKAIIDFAFEREELKEEIGRYLWEIVAALLQSFKVRRYTTNILWL
jgi:UTP-glucose-1-phosphate uridylyltransferase